MRSFRTKMFSMGATVALLFSLASCREVGMRADETVEVPEGTQIHVRVHHDFPAAPQAGDEFQGVLDQPIRAEGRAVVPAGTMVRGEFTRDTGRDTGWGDTGTGVTGDRADDADRREGGEVYTDDRTGRIGVDEGVRRDDQTRTDEPGVARDPAMDRDPAAARDDRQHLSLEVTRLIINGEEHRINTHPVSMQQALGIAPMHRDHPARADEDTLRDDPMATTTLPEGGQVIVFNLSDSVEVPVREGTTEEQQQY
jgi:hypothetical protein